MLVVDAQIHIWRNNKPTNANHRQMTDFTAADVLKEMDEGGVDAAVIHPPGWDPDSNALAVEAARQHPNRLAILGNFPLDKPESRTPLRAQADHRPFRAPRRGLVEPARAGGGGEASQRGPEGDRGAELLGRGVPVSRHSRPHPKALRCLRP